MRHLITNGRVIDPSQRIDANLNVLIENGKILALTQEQASADVVTDASGHVVCPGFIDMHAHEDPVKNGVCYREAEKANLACLLRMGVTTCLAGNCGDNFCDPAEFLDLIDREGCYVNVAMLAGYTWFRERFSRADRYSPAETEERKVIAQEISKALKAGCAGISFGLEYVPGVDAAELQEAATLCAPSRKMIAAHIRGCAEKAVESAEEIIRLGRDHGLPVQLSHIGSMAGYGQMKELLDMVDAWRAQGVDIGCDCYPYTAFSTTIGSAPYDDLKAMHCSYEDIELCEGEFRGKRCTKEVFETERQAHPGYLTVGHVMKAEDVQLAYAHPNVTVGSDCFLSKGQGHPRAAGAFPRFIRQYAIEGELSLNEALFRITALPAERLGLKNKGTLRAGADADLVIFDPKTIRDCATFSEPTLPPEGIDAVFISGQMAVCKGKITNAGLGRAVRKEERRINLKET